MARQVVYLAENQDLPMPPEYFLDENGVYHLVRTIPYETRLYSEAQQDMLRRGWKKVV